MCKYYADWDKYNLHKNGDNSSNYHKWYGIEQWAQINNIGTIFIISNQIEIDGQKYEIWIENSIYLIDSKIEIIINFIRKF